MDDRRAVQDQLQKVKLIQASTCAFAAILIDVTWGNADCGGDSPAVQDHLQGVQQIQARQKVFAAILSDGSVVTWGNKEYGGDSGTVQAQLDGLHQIQACQKALAAILSDGSIVTWGSKEYGGDSLAVQDHLKGVQQIQSSDGVLQPSDRWIGYCLGPRRLCWRQSCCARSVEKVQQIQSLESLFVAILTDGSVVTWGDDEYGGDCGAVQGQLKCVQQI